jgi:chloramphenicol 3-O phosphotransferase
MDPVQGALCPGTMVSASPLLARNACRWNPALAAADGGDEVSEPPRVLVLNGGSSSGKSTLARELQTVLPGTWLRFGIDDLVDALPPALLAGDGLAIGEDGTVVAGGAFRAVERMWRAGIARMAELGAHLIIEDNFVSGPSSQERWREALAGQPIGWVGVRCDGETAAERERARQDRTVGMAAIQADAVHEGISYDLEVDTAKNSVNDNAELIFRHFFP